MGRKKIIEVKNIVKDYKGFKAVKGVSFDVYEGEIFGLLGPNGAGKTTTLEIIETLRDETEGDVIVAGKSINKEPSAIKEMIGVQLQEAGFYPNLTLLQIMNLFADLYDVKIEALSILKKVGLGDKANAIFTKLSGGQKQRFSIATTLINKPKIIFLDEPTTGLDPQARRNLWDLIREINQNETTIVMTTHYMEEAEFLCNRVGIMDEGKIIALDSPDNLVEKLLKTGFKGHKRTKEANLEDVFINLTGKELRDE
ncbi:MAG: ABC transporter related protein [candidate division WS6 bacterium GW2011_GWF2_39_15]|uniref:ABC transporter related protein n=1 Tax=candidate division WS6 bacterium GW2011_GWF2_39_15 TaxID=1619100 RepID=A0A0G0MS42_9BACT|nr:MAG: ABC transporter related protein [candidate division WS6 bacterium GW2011_GWF2_39_15]